MWFSGTSENILETAAPFYTVTKRYNSKATVGAAEEAFDVSTIKAADVAYASFWFGAYKLENNSNYTAGDLVLTYYYGFTLNKADKTDEEGNAYIEYSWESKDGKTTKTLEELIALATGKTPAEDLAALVPDNSAIVTINEKAYSQDIETFTFALDAPSLTKGYTKMSATEKKTEAYIENDEGKAEKVEVRYVKGSGSNAKLFPGDTGYENAATGCDWGVKTRSFDLVGTDAGASLLSGLASKYLEGLDDEDDYSARSLTSVPAALAPIYVEGAVEFVEK